MLLVLRGDEQGLGVKINRIVLQTLTFTSGILGLAPANRGSILLSDSRHGSYLINKARSLFSQPPLLLLFFCLCLILFLTSIKILKYST